jgi:hypothetical protein
VVLSVLFSHFMRAESHAAGNGAEGSAIISHEGRDWQAFLVLVPKIATRLVSNPPLRLFS